MNMIKFLNEREQGQFGHWKVYFKSEFNPGLFGLLYPRGRDEGFFARGP